MAQGVEIRAVKCVNVFATHAMNLNGCRNAILFGIYYYFGYHALSLMPKRIPYYFQFDTADHFSLLRTESNHSKTNSSAFSKKIREFRINSQTIISYENGRKVQTHRWYFDNDL